MSSLRLPRWTALLLLPLLAGALVVMHGIGAGASTTALAGGSSGASTHAHRGEPPPEHHDAGCDGCAVGHVMAACVAIVATAVGLRVAHRSARTRVSTPVDTPTAWIRAVGQLLRPPDPAWVRLAVMRC